MSSLQDLEKALEYIDTWFHVDSPFIKQSWADWWANTGVKHQFKGLSYDLTYNQSLGVPNGTAANDPGCKFIVTQPFDFGNWPSNATVTAQNSEPAQGHGALQTAFKAVLRRGVEMWKADPEATKTTGDKPADLFIDILSLKDGADDVFFVDGSGDKVNRNAVAEAFADVLNDETLVNRKTVRPVIRFLLGTQDPTNVAFWDSLKAKFQNIFWDGDGNSSVKHPLAVYHVGFYAPNFKVPQTGKKQADEFIAQLAKLVAPSMKTTEDKVKGLLDKMFNEGGVHISWNHGKILAVGGKTMMTGGMNFWPHYAPKDNRKIIDMQAAVTGDAAISAHKYANYFWDYFIRGHKTDTNSFSYSLPLTANGTDKNNKPLGKQWVSTQKSTDIPMFTHTKPAHSASEQGAIPVLCVSRLGDWHGGNFDLDYPVQIFDAMRDVLLNAWFPPVPADMAKADRKLIKEFIATLTDIADDGKYFKMLTQTLGYSPAAWASRYARIWAVTNAKKSVRVSNQMIVDTLQMGDGAFVGVKNQANESLKSNWDGALVPYDLLLAFARVLYNLRNDTNKENGVFIVLASHGKTFTGDQAWAGDWSDKTAAKVIRDRTQLLMMGLDDSLSADDCLGIINKKLHLSRVDDTHGVNVIHTKTCCVDEKLLYVGSDNLYPSYNEEHGVWVDDVGAVKSWREGFWDGLWRDTKPKDNEV